MVVDDQFSYASFEARVNRFRVRDVLAMCNYFARQIDTVGLGEAHLTTRNPSRHIPRLQTTLMPWGLAFIAKTALLRSTDNRQRELTEEEFSQLVRMHANLEDAFTSPNNTDLEGFLIRTAWEQFPYQDLKNAMIPRTLMLLKDADEALSHTPIDLGTVWTGITGLSLEEFLAIGFAYLAGVTNYTRIHRHFAARGIFEGKISVDQCEAFLKLTSTTYEDFRVASEPYKVNNPRYVKTEFNVLAQRPLVVVGDELIAPVPRLLLHRISDGIRYDLRDHLRLEDRNPFSEYFGLLFEWYTGRLLKSAFSPSTVFPEPVYGRPELRGPDWIVIDGDTALLFECRTSGLALASKTTADREQLIEDLKRILIQTARRFPGKVSDLRAGKTNVDLDGVTNFVPIVLTHEPAYVEPVLRSFAARELSNEALDYVHFDISDLETLASWNREFPMKEILKEWVVAYRASPVDCGTFLNQWAKAHSLDYRNQILDDRMNEFTESQLGRPYPPHGRDTSSQT
jgi:hypothetical protein